MHTSCCVLGERPGTLFTAQALPADQAGRVVPSVLVVPGPGARPPHASLSFGMPPVGGSVASTALSLRSEVPQEQPHSTAAELTVPVKMDFRFLVPFSRTGSMIGPGGEVRKLVPAFSCSLL